MNWGFKVGSCYRAMKDRLPGSYTEVPCYELEYYIDFLPNYFSQANLQCFICFKIAGQKGGVGAN